MEYRNLANGVKNCPVFINEHKSIWVSSPFNEPRDIGGPHQGCDMGPSTATAIEVVPIAPGTIIKVEKSIEGTMRYSGSAGNQVVVDHGNGWVTKYYHLQYGSIGFEAGAKVTENSVLGKMGNTGDSSGPHLHFQIEHNGVPEDSLPYALGEMKISSRSNGYVPVSNMINSPATNTDSIVETYATDEEFKRIQKSVTVSTGSGHLYEEISDSDFIKIKHVSGVFGLPYQFLPNTDPRLYAGSNRRDITNAENLGYEYAERIIKRIPLLFMTPGKASFMTKFSKEQKKNLLSQIFSDGSNSGTLGDTIDKGGKYYTFEADAARYYNFVNPMCRIAAKFLGIEDTTLSTDLGLTRLDNLNWMNLTQQRVKSISDLSGYMSIPFYVDTDTSISESFDNSTQQSMLASTVNSVSDMAKELNFILGYGAGKMGADDFAKDEAISSSLQNVQDMVNRLLGVGGFFSNLNDHLVTVASGGKLIFPEIWSDSSLSRSYNCKFKFIAPDPSNLSVYLNVLVPLFHLIGLVSPQMPENNPNGYANPFLIRAVYKGFFNIDMGIITSMNVTKGAECQWTPEGVPTSIEVDISIKDLYNAMSITETSPEMKNWKFDTVNNTSEMDYIANLCGINIFKPEIARLIDIWWTNNFDNRFRDLFRTNIWGGIQNKVQNAIIRVFR